MRPLSFKKYNTIYNAIKKCEILLEKYYHINVKDLLKTVSLRNLKHFNKWGDTSCSGQKVNHFPK